MEKLKVRRLGLTVSIAKGLFKCFSCDFSGKSAVDFLMEAQGKTYPEALLYLADKFHVILEYEQQKKGPQRKGGNIEPTFRDRQLQSSGLTNEDQKATVFVDENTRKIIDVFEAGTRDRLERSPVAMI